MADVLELVQPAHLWVPEHLSSAGGEVADLAASAGLNLDPEQRLALDVIFAEQAGGRWAAFEAAIIAQRQNLKTHVFKAVALGGLYLLGEELVTWTAHEFNTAMEAYRDVREIVEGTPHLSKRVEKFNDANGEEGIEFHGGQRLRFRARTKTGGRGITGNRVILDEAFALQASHMGSLMPTMSAQSITGNPQLIYGSSAGLLSSAVLRSVRDRGRAGGDPSLAYIEWAAPEGGCEVEECDHRQDRPGCALDDVERWGQANPAMGRRISVEFIAGERRSLPPAEFARERLGWWEDPPTVEDDEEAAALWAACADPGAVLADPVVFAFDAAPGLSSASIGSCGGPVEVVEHDRGAGWLVARLVELNRSHRPAAIGVDPAGPAGAFIADLEQAGLRVRSKQHPQGRLVLLDGREAVQACGAFHADVLDGELTHRDQDVLNIAYLGAGRRKVGDAWKWSRRDSTVDISPLVAVTVARSLWVARPKVSVPLDPAAHRRPAQRPRSW